jgi:hypothetical protein
MIDEGTIEYIKDLVTINDLQAAEIEEKDEIIRALKAQVQNLLNDCRFPDLKVG